jgi:hypothetical protein
MAAPFIIAAIYPLLGLETVELIGIYGQSGAETKLTPVSGR